MDWLRMAMSLSLCGGLPAAARDRARLPKWTGSSAGVNGGTSASSWMLLATDSVRGMGPCLRPSKPRASDVRVGTGWSQNSQTQLLACEGLLSPIPHRGMDPRR